MSSEGLYTITEAEQRRISQVQSADLAGSTRIGFLVDMLADPSWVVRRAVIDALAKFGGESVEPLCATLRFRRENEARIAAVVDTLVLVKTPLEDAILNLADDQDPAIVADAAQILGRRRSHAAVDTLIRLTRHADDNVAVAAIEALGRIGGRAAVGALLESVQSQNFFRVFPAIDVLGRSGDPRAVEPLKQLLNNPSFLLEAARALGRTGEKSAIQPLTGLLKSSSDAVVRVACLALIDLRERYEEKLGQEAVVVDKQIHSQTGAETVRRLARLLPNSDGVEAVVICKLFGMMGNMEAIPSLTAALDGAPLVAAGAAEALQRIGREADEPLLRELRSGSSARRKALLPVVHRFGAAPDVASCLSDPDREVRALACETLAKLGNSSVVGKLFPLLEDGDARVVIAATAAIQALGSREARELAVKASGSESPIVRRSALRILAYFGDTGALAPTLKGLEDPDSRVREAALQGLPYLDDARAVEALIEATRHPSDRIRGLAMRSLGQLPKSSPRILSLLLRGLADRDSWVRYYACQSVGRLEHSEVTAQIAELLHDEAGHVRLAAVEALSHLRVPEAHQALRAAAQSSEIEIQRTALVGLGIAHRADDLPVVLAGANSDDVATRLMALSALVSFASPLVVGALCSAVYDKDEQVSATAINLLAARPEQDATAVLVDLLANDQTRERAKAALLLAADGRMAGLLSALEEADDELAPILVGIFSRMEQPMGMNGLLAAIKLDNVAARKAAAVSMAVRPELEMMTALEDAAKFDPSAEVRDICLLLLKD